MYDDSAVWIMSLYTVYIFYKTFMARDLLFSVLEILPFRVYIFMDAFMFGLRILLNFFSTYKEG